MKLHKMKKVLTMILTLGLAVCTCATTANASTAADETCTVNYQEQSDGVTVTSKFDEERGVFVIDIAINESASDDQVIDLSDAIIKAMNAYTAPYGYASYPVMPGDSNIFEISITNASGHTYAYKDNSFVLSTAKASNFTQSSILGYDGQLIPTVFVGAVNWTNKAIMALYHTNKSIGVEQAFSIFHVLSEAGYTNQETALSDYMLDYYFKDTANDHTVADLNADSFASIGQNGIFTVTKAELQTLVKNYPEMSEYLYITSIEKVMIQFIH